MITEKQLKKVLERDFYRWKIHYLDDPACENRFMFYRNIIPTFGMSKEITKKQMEFQLKNNFLVSMLVARNRITQDILDIASIGTDCDVWHLIQDFYEEKLINTMRTNSVTEREIT